MKIFAPEENSTAQIGYPVENFSFSTYNPRSSNFEEHSFSEYLANNKWILLFFYPADFTFVCPTELADLASVHNELVEMNIEVISISTDTKFAHLAWQASEKLIENVKFQMAADPTGVMAQYFGIYDYKAGNALRGTFLINPEGILVMSEINYYDIGRNAKELLRRVTGSHFLRQNPDQACPARWEKGQETLVPSIELVGQVYKHINK